MSTEHREHQNESYYGDDYSVVECCLYVFQLTQFPTNSEIDFVNGYTTGQYRQQCSTSTV